MAQDTNNIMLERNLHMYAARYITALALVY